MTSRELENLARIGSIHAEPPSAREIAGLVGSAEARLADATNTTLALASRFDLAYNAAHALALAALRRTGYRSEQRYIVFQVLPHTLSIAPATARVLVKAHEARNAGEYGGAWGLDEALVRGLVTATQTILAALQAALSSEQ